MIQRTIELTLLSLIAGLITSTWTDTPFAAIFGTASGALVWVVFDNLRAARVLRWLRNSGASRPPELVSVWGEVVERTRKVFKLHNRKARKAQARLQEFLAAIQASPSGVVLLNKNAVIEWCNFTAAQHLGFDSQRDLGQQIRNLVRDPAFIAYLNAADFGASIEINGRDALPSHPQRISIHLHSYGKGRKLMLTQDITSVEQAEAMRSDFVANVSHEIRTPLTVVNGFIETLQTLELTEAERTQYLALMNHQAQRMLSLVNDLLTLSRLEGSPIPGATEWVCAHGLLAALVHDAQSLSHVIAHGAHRVLLEPSATIELAGSANELTSAYSNLLNNAVRHTPGGCTIRAGWRVLADGSAELYVHDEGPGIASEHLPRLSERFYRVDRSRSRETGGTGLGLAIVKHVAQRHGGSMQVSSELGVGSTFSIVLPPSRVLYDEALQE